MAQYDYVRQAWTKKGRYVKCGHRHPCKCYGTVHAGEQVDDETQQRMARERNKDVKER